MSKIRVGVLRGGPSNQYELSLQSGSHILRSLPEKYIPHDIFIDQEGTWHMEGIPVLPHELGKRIDVFFNALHGTYGENGKVQNILETCNVPHTGSSKIASAASYNPALAKKIYRSHGLPIPYSALVDDSPDREALALEIFQKFPMPVVIKTISHSEAFFASNFEDLRSILLGLLPRDGQVIVEEYLSGKIAECTVTDGFRGQDLYAFIPVQIHGWGTKTGLENYPLRHGGHVFEHSLLAKFTDEEKKEIEEYAKRAHKTLGARDYSRSYFAVHPHRGVHILETTTQPSFSKESLLPKHLESIGSSFPEFLDHVITLARERG